MYCIKFNIARYSSFRLKSSMKKLYSFFGVFIFFVFISFTIVNSVKAQVGENLTFEEKQENTSQLISGDVDASFTANLFNSPNQNNQAVTALARQNDGKLLIAGNFTFVNGVARTFLVRLNPQGTVDSDFNAPGFSSVQKILPLANGKILLAGSFSNTFNNVNFSGLALLNEDGSIDDDFAFNSSGSILDAAVQADGKIIIGGSFSQINGLQYNSIARINTDGSVDTSFRVGSGADSSVLAVAVQADGKIIIGGAFNKINNVTKPRLARLNADGSIDLTFNSGGTGNTSGPSNSVTEIVVQPNGKILIGGRFTAYNGVTRAAGIARLETNGALDTSFAPSSGVSNSDVELALQSDGKIIAGFIGSIFPNETSSTLVRYNSDGTLDASFSSRVNGSISTLVLANDGSITIGGSFTQVNGVNRRNLAQINMDGSLDNSSNYVLNYSGSATVIAVQADGKILVGGNFEFVNQTPKVGIVRLNTDGSVDESFNITGNFNFFGSLLAITPTFGGKILLGGNFNFTTIDGQIVRRIARLNADGSLDTTFNVGNGAVGNVTEILNTSDGKIIAVGDFFTFNGTNVSGIVRLNENGSIDTTFQTPFSQSGSSTSVFAAALQPDGKILLGGGSFNISGTFRQGIIRLNENGSLDNGFNVLFDSANFNEIVVQADGKILVAGSFSLVNGVSRRNIARLNADGSVDSTFSPRSGANGIIYDLLLDTDGKIWIGGDFTIFNGIRRMRLARLNADGSLDDFNIVPGANATIFALAQQTNGRLIVGGSFTQIGGLTKVGLARVRSQRNDLSSLFDFDGDGKTDFAVFRSAAGEWRISGADGRTDGRLFGLPTDRIVPADYDGDGKTDLAVFRPSSGQWFILNSTTDRVRFEQFGINGDVPLPADYDGDGSVDLAVFRPSNGVWYILRSRDGFQAIQFGTSGDVPAMGDFDGDGKADLAVFRPSNGVWYLLQSASGFTAIQFGISEDIPVPGDYDGDGRTDLSVFRPSNGVWYQLKTTQGFTAVQFGIGTDRPAAGDYDGDGKTDIAVFRASSATWFVLLSSNNTVRTRIFGADGDLPIPAAYLR